MGQYQIKLIGPFGLYAPDGRRIEITSKKAIALISLLVTAPKGERSRRWLETMLWGNREQLQAQASLRRELSTLVQRLHEAGAGTLLSRDTQRVAIAYERVDVDILSIGVSASHSSQWKHGEFLEGLDLKDCEAFEDWLRNERERIYDMLELACSAPTELVLPTARDILGMALPNSGEILKKAPLSLPPKPSLAVLPFEELGKGNGWMGIGLADEVGVILSQFPQLFIVSSAAARALSAQALPNREIATALGVRYLLAGTVTRLGTRLRVSVMLIEGQLGEQVWAQTFIGQIDDLFELQKDIATSIAPQIWTMVDISERRHGLRLAGVVHSDYELYWRANALFRSWERSHISEAMALTAQLVENNPICPWAASLAAYCHSIDYLMGFSENRAASRRQAVIHYQSALRYGEDNPEALGYAAGTLLNIGGDLGVADRLIGHALSLLPAHQPTLFWGGWVDVANGQVDRARERFELALRINPVTGVRGQTLCGMGFACLQRGQFEEAFNLLQDASQSNPDFFLSRIGLLVVATLIDRWDVVEPLVQGMPSQNYLEFIGLFKKPEHRKMFQLAMDRARALTLQPGGQKTVPGVGILNLDLISARSKST